MATDLCERLATVLDERAEALTAEWAAEVTDRLGLETRPFLDPADPWTVRGIAEYLAGKASPITAVWRLVDRTRQLGVLAAEREVIPEQILDAYLILGERIWPIAHDELVALEGAEPLAALLPCTRRLNDALAIVVRATTGAYFDRYEDRIRADAERLRGFNRMVSHELKGPLGAIQGAATLLSDESVVTSPEKRGRYLEIVQRNTARMADLIDDLLALTMVERPAEGAVREPVRLAEALESVRDRVAEDAEAHGVAVAFAAPPAKLAVDRRALELVLGNLVNNAIRYSDPGRPERYVRVTARHREEENAWVVAVEDNGLGIPEEAGARVFERFYRGRPEVPGTGLGLSIVKEVVERWDGRVWFEPRDGGGTVFYFTAPAAV